MLGRLPLLLVPLALAAAGCTTSPTQSSLSDAIVPLSTVTREDARALDRKRAERREMAKSLLDRAEERSKTHLPSIWGLNLAPESEITAPVRGTVEILSQPWTALQKVLAPGARPSSSTATISR